MSFYADRFAPYNDAGDNYDNSLDLGMRRPAYGNPVLGSNRGENATRGTALYATVL